MAGKTPRKGASGKRPIDLKNLNQTKAGSAPMLSTNSYQRPRRFSLIYSSDSSLSNLSDLENKKKGLGFKNPKLHSKAKRRASNAMGKASKLIQESAIDDESDSTTSSVYQAVSDNDNDDDDDDEDDDYSSSSSSSDDENIDFVKLSAERKKRAMQAMNALKRGKSPMKDIPQKSPQRTANTNANENTSKNSTAITDTSLDKDSSTDSSDNEALAFNFKQDDGIRFGDVSNGEKSDEDLGEEVRDENKHSNKSLSSKSIALKSNNVDQLNVPQISESEESDYDIDQDIYFKTLEDDNENGTGMDTGLETGEDDAPILHEEEQNIVLELENDDELSFDGSIHEEGEDPVETERIENKSKGTDSHGNNNQEEDSEDEMMSDFDVPFYEDPKFANLYYCDGSDQPLTLSTSLPLILNEEKRRKLDKKQAKRREREERIKRRKMLRDMKKEKTERSTTPDLGGDEYLFGLFFRSDDENVNNGEFESPLRRLGSTAPTNSEYSTDEEYENILLDIAHMPTDDESLNTGDEANINLDDDDDDDDVSVSNVFIDIDDLDPDAFYFHYEDSSSDEEDGRLEPGNSEGPKAMGRKSSISGEDDYLEAVIYVDDESTDEDETLPPPSSRNKKIGSKAKEVVSANVVGLKPPKLGTWETDDKPFSIIDGLSTKSLYPLHQDPQQLLEQHQRQQQALSATELGSGGEKEELTLNELLNMSELEDEDGGNITNANNNTMSDWYAKPKVPLSAFRNKGVSVDQEDEYMLPIVSARKFPIGYVGSERTRKKIDRMKELQKKKDEKRRKLKKKKKLLKLKRERERLDKERAMMDDRSVVTDMNLHEVPASNALLSPGSHDSNRNLDTPDQLVLPRKNSVKGMDLDDINNLLNRSDTGLVANIGTEDAIKFIGDNDADILASLTAPIDLENDTQQHLTNTAAWRRRQSIAEAAAENLRFTKSGLFSESALADLEQIIGHAGSGSILELNEMLQ